MMLTTVNIDELEAGRELDALIARQVMLWTWKGMTEDWFEGFESDDHYDIWVNTDNGSVILEFKPSINIYSAWRVLEKFDEFQVWKNESGDYGAECLYTDSLEYAAKAHTASLAICRAALKAVAT